MSLALKVTRLYFKISSVIAPRATGKRAFRVFQKVRLKSIRKRELGFFEEARKFVVQGKYENLECFELGDPSGQLTLLVHGWESNAGSMSSFAFRLAEEGHRVVTFNLPGHAQYESSSTNLLQCFVSMNDVLNALNPTEPINVISHSLGSAVTANALSRSKYAVNRLTLLTTPLSIEDIFQEFKRTVALGDKAYNAMLAITENLLGEPLSKLDVDFNLNKIDYKELLLIHDEHDRIIPFENSRTIDKKTAHSSLTKLEKVGHYKMLWTEEVIDEAVSFVVQEESVIG